MLEAGAGSAKIVKTIGDKMKNGLLAVTITFTALFASAQEARNDLRRISMRVNQEIQQKADFLDLQTQGRVVEMLRAISRELNN